MVGVTTHADVPAIPGGTVVRDRSRVGDGEDRFHPTGPERVWPLRMINPIRHYDWGSLTALARVQGRAPACVPEAELWMGAHPRSPSTLVDVDGRELNLLTLVETAPETVLGLRQLRRFGPRLPFLLKVIAVESPLSVHVHPDDRQSRVVRDRGPRGPEGSPGADEVGKSELVVATEPFEALIGVRDPRRAAELLDLVEVAPLLPIRQELRATARMTETGGRRRILDTVVRLASWPRRQRAMVTAAVTDAVRAALVDPRIPRDGDTRPALEWVLRLARGHPDDPLVLAPLLLNLVRLDPGGAVYIPPGVPHSYLRGTAVEAGTASENVVRAGLTHKPVDPTGFRRWVDPTARPVLEAAWRSMGPYENAVDVPGTPFRLSRVRVGQGRVVGVPDGGQGPQVVLCLHGTVSVWAGVRQVGLDGGESAFLGPGIRDCALGGSGEVFRICVPDRAVDAPSG
jgi:mannose-6-phosphate isomerase